MTLAEWIVIGVAGIVVCGLFYAWGYEDGSKRAASPPVAPKEKL